MTKKSLNGKTALITGASSGIGRETAKTLSREGANVAVAARRENRLEKVATKIRENHGVETLVLPTDVRKKEKVEQMVDKTIEKFQTLDIVVNNAGISRGSKVENLSTSDYQAMTRTNVDGMFFTTRAVIPHLKKSEGNLIFVGSIASQYPRPFNPVYAATKWWTRGFALSVEASVGDQGIAVSIVNPSEVRTEFGDPEEHKEIFEEGEITEPEEVAEAIIFAAKQENSTISEIDIYRTDKLFDIIE